MDEATVQKTVFFDASRDVVWAYLTDKDKLGDWFHPGQADLEQGASYTLFKAGDRSTTMLKGVVLVADKPKFLCHTGAVKPIGDVMTTISWTLDDVAGGTRLHLVHEGFGNANDKTMLDSLMKVDQGWDRHFSDLRSKLNG